MKSYLKPAIILCFLFQFSFLCAVTFHIAPVSYIDSGEIAKDSQSTKTMNDIHAKLQEICKNKEVFSFVSVGAASLAPPVSIFDAASLCTSEKIEYLLYGYIQKDAYSWSIELKLFDNNTKTILRTFYSSDDIGSYDRLIDDISVKLLSFLEEKFGLPLSLGNKDFGTMSFLIPAGLGYWTSTHPDWLDVILGTFVVTTGIEYVPCDSLSVIYGKNAYSSIGIDLEYRLGIGNPENYGAFLHSISLQLPLRLHVDLNSIHSVTFGTTFLYSLDVLQIEEKYAAPAVYTCSTIGFGLNLGYRLKINDTIKLFFENKFDTRYGTKNFSTISPRIGMLITCYTKELEEEK
jgi:hypothetical protein